MKILNLLIRTPEGEILRNIDINETGISYIFGDVKEPQNKRGTSNSIGKSLLLKCIDYFFGANEDSKAVKEVIHGYIIEALIEKNNSKYHIRRILGSSEEIFINEVPHSLTQYKDFLNIKRSVISKQIVLNKKSHLISQRSSANKEDNLNFIKLINLDDIIDDINKIYESQDSIKQYKNNRADLVKFYGEFESEIIAEEIYFIDKEVERLCLELEQVSKKIKNIEISSLQINAVEEYSNKTQQLKRLKRNLDKTQFECQRLLEFVASSDKADITSAHISVIFEKSKIEVPEMVKKKIEDVEIFHKKVFEERKVFLDEKRVDLENEIVSLQTKINDLSLDIDKLGKMISINQVYQESLALYSNYSDELQELKYKQGELSQVKTIDDKISEEDDNLGLYFASSNKIISEYKEIISEYREFVNSITTSIYENDVYSYFDVKIRKKHLKNRPVIIDLVLKGDTGEGVSEVKKNIVDYLMFRYNTELDFLIQDSSCFNGIDPRQVVGMLKQLEKIAVERNKQVIIAINSYQLGNDLDVIEEVKSKCCIELSEKNKLFKFDFD